MKYITFEQKAGLQYPVTFPRFIPHAKMVERIGDKPISAGFCKIVHGKIRAYGESISLRVKSDPDRDGELLNFEL